MKALLLKGQKVTKFLYQLYVLKVTPVVIFAPGRVGSMALHKNLQEAGVFVFKLEFLDIGDSGAAHFVIRHVFKRKRPAKLITIIRDPVTMMVSYFFSKASAGHLPEAHQAWKEKDVPKLQELFIRDVLESYRLDSHLYWYETDFLRATGIDIFGYVFDTVNKNSTIDHPLYPTLILRTEMDDEVKVAAIIKFLQIPPFILTRENTRSQKADKELYEAFKKSLSVPPEILQKIYTSKLCTHFFSSEEITTLRNLWSKSE